MNSNLSVNVLESALTQRADFSELLILLKAAPRATFVFGLYNTAGTREELTEAVRRFITPVPVFSWTYTPDNPFPISYLSELSEKQKGARAIVFFFDLERGDEHAWKSLDHNRDFFAQQPHTLFFWVTQKGRKDAANKAPHFWAQRSVVFDFTVEQEQTLGELRGEWAGRDLWIDNHEDAVRQLRVFQGLLDEYRAQPDPPALPLADLNGKVARLLAYLDRREETLPFLRDQLALARSLNDRDLQAEALTNLAQVERIRTGNPAALPLLEEALTLAKKPHQRALVLQNLGSVIYGMGQAERALTLLDDALSLFKLVGENLGQANVLKAIGDVQSFHDENDDALRSYDHALSLFNLVGDNLGQANVSLGLGKLSGEAHHFEQAIALHTAIGSHYDVAVDKFYFGVSVLQNKEGERAVKLLLEARATFEQINFSPGVQAVESVLQQLSGEADAQD